MQFICLRNVWNLTWEWYTSPHNFELICKPRYYLIEVNKFLFEQNSVFFGIFFNEWFNITLSIGQNKPGAAVLPLIHSLKQKERPPGWPPWPTHETLKVSFNFSSEFQGCHPDDLSVSLLIILKVCVLPGTDNLFLCHLTISGRRYYCTILIPYPCGDLYDTTWIFF